MPLLAPVRTDAERIAQRLADNPVLADVFAKGLDGVHHVSFLAQPTVEFHDNVRNKWREFTDFHRLQTLPADIILGAKMVTEDIVKEFVLYLAAALRGRITENSARRSVLHYICTFFACWPRYANQAVPTQLRFQVLAYLNSLEFASLVTLSTEIRPKPLATPLDLDAMIRHSLNDTHFFRTNRSRVQFNGVNIMGSLTGERIGCIVEATHYQNTNQSIQWRDIIFSVLPNPADPFHPFIATGIGLRNGKGHRDDPAFYRVIYVILQPLGARAGCLVTILLYLALRDRIFANGVETIDQILSPAIPPTAKYELRIKDEAKNQPVFRSDELGEDGKWRTSATQALKASAHNNHLRKMCAELGYLLNITMHCWRRTAANAFQNSLSEQDRDMMLTHAPGTDTFVRCYQTRAITLDLPSIRDGRAQDPHAVALAKAATAMTRAEGAPTALTLQQRAALEREPELAEMRATLVKFKFDIAATVTEIKTLDDEDPDADEAFASLQGRLRSRRVEHDVFRAKYDSIVNREAKHRLKIAREEFFDGVAGRQLRGEAGPSAPSMALARSPLKDKTRQAVEPVAHRVIASSSSGKENPAAVPTSLLATIEAIDPAARLCDILYRFEGLSLVDETEAAVRAYLGAPERTFAACYPGESPTDDEKCPVCSTDCSPRAFVKSGSQTVGSHIHACLHRAQQKSVQKQVEDAYKPRRCDWKKCKDKSRFETRPDFVAHIQKHLLTLKLPPTSVVTTRQCLWPLVGGTICKAEGVDDWERHFGEVHGINVQESIEVEYCAICPEWYVDDVGDGIVWSEHQSDHLDALFGPFSHRVETDVDLTPIGVEFNAERTTVAYAHSTGFSGLHPEFHGDIRLGVAHAPALCPFCVFNEDLRIERRMLQFLRHEQFVRHLLDHVQEIDDGGDAQQCPVPSCGVHKFTAYDLKIHVIAFHRVPLCSATTRSQARCLKLPTVPVPVPAAAALTDLTHLMDVDPPSTVNAAPAKLTWLTAAKGKKKEVAAAAKIAVPGHCMGCWINYVDIGKHLESTKCRIKNQYKTLAEGKPIGGRLSWDLKAPPPDQFIGRETRKLHRCGGTCRRQYHDIREHLADSASKCQPTFFFILQPQSANAKKDKASAKGKGKSAKDRTAEFGPRVMIADWLAEQAKIEKARKSNVPEFVQGSSKRPRSTSVSNSEGNNDNDSDDAPLPKRPHLPSPPSPPPPSHPMFMCNKCNKTYDDAIGMASHFGTLTARSKCRARIFRLRDTSSTDPARIWTKPINWETWAGNPANAEMIDSDDESN
ncbi:hypothetical protein C8R47DRAFT_423481 [Mycena vitilis]|nr:hypothetical protein C8R47DRAFT_423481 [Mycena vitilis]